MFVYYEIYLKYYLGVDNLQCAPEITYPNENTICTQKHMAHGYEPPPILFT